VGGIIGWAVGEALETFVEYLRDVLCYPRHCQQLLALLSAETGQVPPLLKALATLTDQPLKEWRQIEAGTVQPRTDQQAATACDLTNVQYLKSRWCLNDLTQFKLLRFLQVDEIQALPERIGDCSQLAHLDVSECGSLQALPERIGDCSQLAHLDVRRCRSLQALPERIGDCSQLVLHVVNRFEKKLLLSEYLISQVDPSSPVKCHARKTYHSGHLAQQSCGVGSHCESPK
jgi:hypothetical protein